MATITADRKGEFVRTALQVLADNDGHLPAREVFKETEKPLWLSLNSLSANSSAFLAAVSASEYFPFRWSSMVLLFMSSREDCNPDKLSPPFMRFGSANLSSVALKVGPIDQLGNDDPALSPHPDPRQSTPQTEAINTGLIPLPYVFSFNDCQIDKIVTRPKTVLD